MRQTLQEYIAKVKRGKLCPTYASEEKGIWHIQATSFNADFSGPHILTTLGYVEGTYKQAFEWAILKRDFSVWDSADGYITKIEPIKL